MRVAFAHDPRARGKPDLLAVVEKPEVRARPRGRLLVGIDRGVRVEVDAQVEVQPVEGAGLCRDELEGLGEG